MSDMTSTEPSTAIDWASEGKRRLYMYLDALVPLQTLLREDDPADSSQRLHRLANRPPPKIIWIYWHQGWHSAPRIAQACLKSWIAHNPGWQARAIDRESVERLMPGLLPSESVSSLTGFSDLVRLKLLAAFGGVWADATVYCSQPIEVSINLLTQLSHFFAFSHPAPDRLIASWFLVAYPESPLIAKWHKAVDAYFAALARDGGRTHAYFFVHYIFEYLMRNQGFNDLYRLMPQVSVNSTGRVASLAGVQKSTDTAPDEPISSERLTSIHRIMDTYPIHKLTWKGAVRAGTRRAEQLTDLLEARAAGAEARTG